MNDSRFSKNLDEVLFDVRRLRARFAPTARCEWNALTAVAELSVQIGHLALCILRRADRDVTDLEDPKRPLINVGDELADVALAALSIAVLTQTEPTGTPLHRSSAGDETEAFHRLSVAAGTLSEAAMVDSHHRHQPAGRHIPLAEAASDVIAACEELAEHLGLDLLTEFRSMVVEADHFLDEWGGTP